MSIDSCACRRCPKERLGAGGLDGVRKHAWFKDLDWKELKLQKLRPPYIPEVRSVRTSFPDLLQLLASGTSRTPTCSTPSTRTLV